MPTRARVAIAGIVTVVFMALAVNIASATHIRILNSERGFRVAWTEDGSSETDGVLISCEVTLEGTWSAATFAKTVGTTIGRVTRSIVGQPCRRGNMRVLTETLPWPVQYNSFSGTLPVITRISVSILNESFGLEEGGGGFCLYRSEARHPERYILNLSEAGGGLRRLDTWTIDETAVIPLGGNVGCELISVRFIGTATGTVLGETAKVIIALI